MLLDTVVPATTSPKSITRGSLLTQYPSDVEIDMLATGGVEAEPARRTYPDPPVVHHSTNVEYVPVLLVRNSNGTVIDSPVVSISPTLGKLDELNPDPKFPSVILLNSTGPSSESTLLAQALPKKLSVSAPMFDRISEEESPVFAPSEPTTRPPKFISGVTTSKKADFETVVPVRLIGRTFEYLGTALLVYKLRLVLATPGMTLPKEAFFASSTELSARSQVTGKENEAPTASGPLGRVEFEHFHVPTPVIQPFIDVRGIKVVQFISKVFVEPMTVSPKSTGDEHFKGKATGDPMHIMLPFEVVTYSRPSPKAGRKNLLRPPVGGKLMGESTPLTGTALNALKPASGSVIQRMPVPALPLYEVIVGVPGRKLDRLRNLVLKLTYANSTSALGRCLTY
jgi:hypothetical protein